MKRYKKFFVEKRKNPSMNPHVGAWDYLEQYKNDPDVYISFTDIDKIGINPRSKYNTPVGIYCYPLKEFIETYTEVSFKDLENFANDFFNESTADIYKKRIGDYAPFAGNSKYVNFIKLKNKSHFINDMYTDYTSADYDRDIKILEDKYKDVINGNINIEKSIKKVFNNLFNHESKDLIGNYDLIQNIVIEELPMLKRFQIESLAGTLSASFNMILPKNWKKNIKEDLVDFFETEFLFKYDTLIKGAIADSKEKNSVMSMWNITRELSRRLSSNAKQASTKWNLILSKDLGYSGFADKSGKGYIHPSEPMQAVFFRKNAFELLHRVENKPAKEIR